MVMGLLASLIAVLFYGRRTAFKLNPVMPTRRFPPPLKAEEDWGR
jgi:hypothetical protein